MLRWSPTTLYRNIIFRPPVYCHCAMYVMRSHRYTLHAVRHYVPMLARRTSLQHASTSLHHYVIARHDIRMLHVPILLCFCWLHYIRYASIACMLIRYYGIASQHHSITPVSSCAHACRHYVIAFAFLHILPYGICTLAWWYDIALMRPRHYVIARRHCITPLRHDIITIIYTCACVFVYCTIYAYASVHHIISARYDITPGRSI